MHLGTSPYFDDPRVEWWFGDATKSLQSLSKDYFGSFDLVLVDLLNSVVDTLLVTEKLSLMDAIRLLVKEDGIISKPEDFPVRKFERFSRYIVESEYEFPHVCRHQFTVGSDKIDFLTATQYDHQVPPPPLFEGNPRTHDEIPKLA